MNPARGEQGDVVGAGLNIPGAEELAKQPFPCNSQLNSP